MPSSTVYHIALVTEGWLRGLENYEDDKFPTEEESATIEDAERLLDRRTSVLTVCCRS